MSDMTEVIGELVPIQQRISEHETESILERWEFGGVLIQKRTGKQLPRGLRAEIEKKFGLEASEITRRMQLAAKFATLEEVQAACNRCGGSWRQVIKQLANDEKQSKPIDFAQRAGWRIDKWIAEVGDNPAHRADLVKVFEAALAKLTTDRVEVPA